ncbi:hypothetical protein [Eubacterium ruminantium]|uniref:hypothetical protein n=1 Tax=Eubacterium ruminantium TaxID=42322 RepID=UPI0015695560|nr:hypothetical protein [Eubacterium ruminantium]
MRGKVKVWNRIFRYDICYDVPTILFFAGFFLHEISVIMDTSMWSFSESDQLTPLGFFAKIIRFTAYGLLAAKILYECKIGNRNIIFVYMTVGIIGLSFISSKNATIVFYLLIMIATLGISDKTVLSASIIAQSFMLIMTVGAAAVGIIENVIRDDDNRVRHFLGFEWTTTGPIIFLFIVFQFIYLKEGRLNILNYMILNVINVIFFIYTDSRMVFATILGATTFFLIFGVACKKGRIVRWLKWIFFMIPWALAGLSIYFQKIYNEHNKLFFRANKLLSGRLGLGHNAIKEMGIHLLGRKVKWVGNGIGDIAAGDYNYVDNSYLQLTLEYGLIFLVLLLAIYSVIMYKAYKSKKYYAVWIVIFILIFGITEPRLFNLAYNPFILLAFSFMGNAAVKKTNKINKM